MGSPMVLGIGIGVVFAMMPLGVGGPAAPTFRILQEDLGLILTENGDPLRQE